MSITTENSKKNPVSKTTKRGRSIKRNAAIHQGFEKIEFLKPKEIFVFSLESGSKLAIHQYFFKNFYSKLKIERGKIGIGIDPGTVNFGVTIFDTRESITEVIGYKCSLVRADTTFDRVSDFLISINKTIELSKIQTINPDEVIAVVEGSAFNSYREVELAELRGALAVWFYHKYNIKINVIPPRTIRKEVFGSGNIKNPFENLQNDLAASYGMCLMGLKLKG